MKLVILVSLLIFASACGKSGGLLGKKNDQMISSSPVQSGQAFGLSNSAFMYGGIVYTINWAGSTPGIQQQYNTLPQRVQAQMCQGYGQCYPFNFQGNLQAGQCGNQYCPGTATLQSMSP